MEKILTIAARPRDPNRDDIGEFIRAFEEGLNVNAKDEKGRTALHHASSNGNSPMVEALLVCGADPNLFDNKGRTPLFDAVDSKDENSVRHLLSKKANPNAQDMNGETPLHHAFMGNNRHAARSLLDAGAKIDLPNLEGDTPMEIGKVNEKMKGFLDNYTRTQKDKGREP